MPRPHNSLWLLSTILYRLANYSIEVKSRIHRLARMIPLSHNLALLVIWAGDKATLQDSLCDPTDERVPDLSLSVEDDSEEA